MNIAPVYPVGVVMDAFIANPVEFWTRENPIKGSQRWLGGQPQAQLTPSPDGHVRLDVAGAHPGAALYVQFGPDALLAWDERGELLARVTDVDGRAALVGGTLFEPSESGGSAQWPRSPADDGATRRQ